MEPSIYRLQCRVRDLPRLELVSAYVVILDGLEKVPHAVRFDGATRDGNGWDLRADFSLTEDATKAVDVYIDLGENRRMDVDGYSIHKIDDSDEK